MKSLDQMPCFGVNSAMNFFQGGRPFPLALTLPSILSPTYTLLSPGTPASSMVWFSHAFHWSTRIGARSTSGSERPVSSERLAGCAAPPSTTGMMQMLRSLISAFTSAADRSASMTYSSLPPTTTVRAKPCSCWRVTSLGFLRLISALSCESAVSRCKRAICLSRALVSRLYSETSTASATRSTARPEMSGEARKPAKVRSISPRASPPTQRTNAMSPPSPAEAESAR
mmetsp:Transcript_3249/g.8590  ORF Transcript_3249/g.8590 Transcript_3249/m.8590 type:complete len:228 (+) Transcript_3249:113-796(+)